MPYKLTTLLVLCQISLFAQSGYYTELPPMPERVTNNAVTGAWVNDTFMVYSFAGLDSTKTWSGIHLNAWKMNTTTGEWSALPPVPDPEGGKIAAAASTVRDKIYLIGGYHVAANGNEVSSTKVHCFDPATGNWESDGAPLPKAIDDHVQAVWRDSLIFVVTGWSNSQNVPNVQIYDPAENTWLTGTAVPNNNNYKAFGASGVIVGDTLYYCGGASSGSNFPAVNYFRKGYINPNNPAEISWSAVNTAQARGYRMAAGKNTAGPVWIGGSDITYNYDGIAYNGSGGVPALSRLKVYFPVHGSLDNSITSSVPAVMDLRGVAQLDSQSFIIVGGMEPGQEVSRRVYRIEIPVLVPTAAPADAAAVQVFPIPATNEVYIVGKGEMLVRCFNATGQMVGSKNGIHSVTLNTSGFASGYYFLQVLQEGHWQMKPIMIK